MASIDITTQSGAVGNGDLQLQNGAPMDGTLRFVTDAVNTASPLKLSTSLVQTTSTLKITTNDNPYIDAEDGTGNNRFTVGRDTGSQQVNVDFASNPGGSTTIVGAIRTYVDGVNLSEVMAFREDGNIGINTLTPGAKLDIHSASNVILQINRTGAGKSWLQYLQAGTARWNTGYDNTNGNFTIYDAVAAADRMVVTNAGNVGIGTSAPATTLDVNGGAIVRGSFSGFTGGELLLNAGNNQQVALSTNGTGTCEMYFDQRGTSTPLWKWRDLTDTRMTLTSVGLGIGTTAPESKLHVADSVSGGIVSIFVDNNINALNSTAQIKFTVDAGGSLTTGGAAIQAVNVDPNYANTDLVFRNTGITVGNLFESMRITNTGNVGIGTSAPVAKLEVAGTSANTDFRISRTVDATANLYITAPGGATLTSIFGISGTDIFSIDTNKYIRLASASGGIQFNGDTAAANALDDYEEGTWTMGISFGGGSTGIAYTANTGTYTKIGRQVTLNGFVLLSSKGSSTGSAAITGLPFTPVVSQPYLASVSLRIANISFVDQYMAYLDIASGTIFLQQITNAGVLNNILDSNFASDSSIVVNLTYFV